MRKLIVSTYLTLDGVMSLDADMAQRWHFPFFNDELAKDAREQLFAADALLLGRRTYDGFAASWPSITDEEGSADRINQLPKYVVSTTLATADWTNTTIIGDQVPDAVASLKQQPGQDILLYGSANPHAHPAAPRPDRRVPAVAAPGGGRQRPAAIPRQRVDDLPAAHRDHAVQLRCHHPPLPASNR